jgi:cytochrome P450 family 110
MKQPPSQQTQPLWNLMQWIVRPLEFLEECAQQHGDCFSVQFGNLPPLIFFSHPQAIETIFTASSSQFDSGRANWILRTTVGDHSLLLLDGDRHQRQRQLLMPPFHGERMRDYGQLIGQITEDVISQWQVGQPFVLRPYMQEISLRVILRAVFGLDTGDRYQQLKQKLSALLEVTSSRFGFATSFFPILQRDLGAWSPGGQFIRFKQQIDQLLYAEIHDRRNQPDADRTDILSLLLAARDAAGQPMSDEELRDELITLLVAGHETTATAITWAMYWLHRHPAVRHELLTELNTLGSEPEPMAIARLPYLNAVCSETLRIYPVGFIAEIRIAKAPIQVMGYDFEPEAHLVPCVYLSHHRDDLYPDSKQFKPERFLDRQFSPFEFFPFGGSNRRCIGAAFALFEMKLVLATILSRYQLTLANQRPVVPVRRGVTIAPQGGVKMVVTARSSSQPPVQTTPLSV